MTPRPFMAIAIARQVGAGGATLGRRLARRLGYAYLDRAILRMVARRTGITDADLSHWDEHVSRFWERLAEVFAVGPPEAVYAPGPTSPGVRDQELFHLESQVILKAASDRSVVVIGRGGSCVLRDHPGLVSIYLHAPLAARIPRVMQAHRLADERAARELIERMDADRGRFRREMTGRSVGDAHCYHLSVDTDRVGLDLAEEMIVRLTERIRERIGLAGS
jgi:CMP/dCMP kinase